MALIGISGKIGSGKDTVGNIIQYLTNENTLKFNHSYEDYLNSLSSNEKYEIKKFADSLKDMICILIGCTRKQLEDQEFKNKELGEEWWIYKEGKFIFNYDKKISNHRLFAERYEEECKITPRKFLQLLGTECGRNIIHPNIWVNSLFSKYNYKYSALKIMDGSTNKINTVHETPESKWIITDVRFPNELQAIENRNGITIRVNSDYRNSDKFGRILIGKTGGNLEHESEIALDNAEFNYTIDNNGTIDDLIEIVKTILITEKLIV